MSLASVWTLVSCHRKEEQKPSLTEVAVNGCVKRLKAEQQNITKWPQGSYDIESKMSRARYNFALQFALYSLHFELILIRKTQK